MSVRFDTQRFFLDFDASRKRRKISINRAAARADLHPSTLHNLATGKISDITVNTLAKMLDFMGKTDINQYIVTDEEH